MKRRSFIEKSGLMAAGSMLVPQFLKAFERGYKPSDNGKVLVVIQLSGGNDGLNTVVPYRNDIYYKLRPNINIVADKVLTLNDELGLNPALKGFKSLYDNGLMTIINNVGYPNPDRSHFRSMDIWQTASDSDRYLFNGWIGRYLDASCNGQCTTWQGIEMDDSLSLAMKGNLAKGLAVRNTGQYYQTTQQFVKENLVDTAQEHSENPQVAYLYRTLAEAVSSAKYLYEKNKVYKSTAAWPQNDLARQLKAVSELIVSGVGTTVYYVSISGFDTHIKQNPAQDKLLEGLGNTLEVFMNELKQNNRLQDVLVLTFSEFGRRVAQNGSQGTDHGTANNLFLFGGALAKPGILNPAPNLTDLDNGDLKFTTDFRQVYANILNNWLGADDVKLLGKKFETLGLVKG